MNDFASELRTYRFCNCPFANGSEIDEIVKKKKMPQLYTLNDVRQRNGKDGADTWIVIKDIVYNVTKYLDEVNASVSTQTIWRHNKSLDSVANK